MTDRTSRVLRPGIAAALASAVLFGVAAPLSKLLLGVVDPFMLAGLCYLGAGVGLAGLRLLSPTPREEGTLSRADLPWLAGAVVSGGVVAPVLLMLGLARTSATSGALLLNVEGLATMAIAWVVFGENVDRRLILGAAAILAGAVLLSWDGRSASLDTGGLLVVAACAAWGIDNNLTRRVSAADPVKITVIKGCVAGAVNVLLARVVGAAFPVPAIAACAGLLGFFSVGVSLVLFIRALRHLGTARTGAYFSLAPFVGAVVSLALPGETVTLPLIAAGGLMGFGLWLHLDERHEHEHTHAGLEHDHVHVHDDHHLHTHDGPVAEPHAHRHRHAPLCHTHVHFPDLHHRHGHG